MGETNESPAMPATLEEALSLLQAQTEALAGLNMALAQKETDLQEALRVQAAQVEQLAAASSDKETEAAKLKEALDKVEDYGSQLRAMQKQLQDATSGKPTVTVEAEGDLLALFGAWLAKRRSMVGPMGRDEAVGKSVARQLVESFARALSVDLPSREDTEAALEAVIEKLPDVKG